LDKKEKILGWRKEKTLEKKRKYMERRKLEGSRNRLVVSIGETYKNTKKL